MLVKVSGGFAHATKLTSRAPPQREMMVVARAVFVLKPNEPVALCENLGQEGYLSGDVFAKDDDERTGALLRTTDLADHKARADLLLEATCWPGQGREVTECSVAFRVGEWSKSARVFGRRTWTGRAADPISAPAPFASMPLGWSGSFGGPGYPKNPVGRGCNTEDLPTVENPRDLVKTPRDRVEPVGFGPVSPAWPPREGKNGKDYGPAWRKVRAPFFATDFDWGQLNAAPADQQLPRFLRGDEDLAFDCMHPDASHFVTRLPGVRPRAFVRYVDGRTLEVGMNLDTLLADVNRGKLFLTWRGLVPVTEDDLIDVRTLVIGSDSVVLPKPEAQWVAKVDEHEADPLGMKTAVSEETRQKIAEAQAQIPTSPPEPIPSAEELTSNPFGVLRGGIAKVTAGRTPEEQAQALDAVDQLKAQTAAAQARLDALPKADPPASFDVYGKATEALAAQRATLTSPEQIAHVDQATAELAKIKQLHADAETGMKAAAANTNARVDLPPPTADGIPANMVDALTAPRSDDPPGPRARLMSRDLSGRDLSGMNLRRASLRGANLRGANLSGACLEQADLSGADLGEAQLAGADLEQANFADARAKGASFAGARLFMTLLSGTDLTGADLSGADVRMAVLTEVVAPGAVLRGASFTKVFFSKGLFERADFTDAKLDTCVFSGSALGQATFERSSLTKVSFLKSDLTGASLALATGAGCAWQGAILDGASLRGARFTRAHFTEASLRGADLTAAILVGARFYRAKLERAIFLGTNLRQADLSKSVVSETTFADSNLYDAKLLGVVTQDRCDFSGANTKAVRWEA